MVKAKFEEILTGLILTQAEIGGDGVDQHTDSTGDRAHKARFVFIHNDDIGGVFPEVNDEVGIDGARSEPLQVAQVP